jgi:hypothetical protein
VGKSEWEYTESDFYHEVRENSKNSLFYFAAVVLQMHDLTEDLHLPYASFIQLLPWNGGPPNSLRKLAWMPRGHFKSSIASIAFPLWLLIHDRNTSIGLISSKEKQVQEWLREIQRHVKYNQFFRWAFPEIRVGAKCDEHELLVQRTPDYMGSSAQASVTAYSIKGGMASQHCNHLVLDDPLHENNAFSETERETAIRLYTHLESAIRDYKTSTFTLVGTPWPGYDVIAHAMEHEVAHGERLFWGVGAQGGFKMSESLYGDYPQLVPNLEARLKRDGVIFKEICPKEKLVKIKRQDLNQYYYQYLCTRPAEGDNGFDIKLVREFAQTLEGRILCECHPSHDHHLSSMVVVGICDPALTEHKFGCESAIVVVARDPVCGCRFILEEWGGHVQSPELVYKMREVMHRWQTYMKRFAIEDVQFQAVFKGWLEELKSVGQVPLGIELYGVKPKKRDKDLRIVAQQSYVLNGLWHRIPKMYYDEGRCNWTWQVDKWPNQPKKRDRIDAWAYCDDAWEGLVATARRNSQQQVHPLKALNKARVRRDMQKMQKAREA